MLTELCQELRNWFERDIFYGSFTIADGVLTYEDGTELPLLTFRYYANGVGFNTYANPEVYSIPLTYSGQ